MPATPHRLVLALTAISLLLPACSTVSQNGVVATDMGASLSQLWGGTQDLKTRFSVAQHSDMMSGALRPSVQPDMQFMPAPKHSSDASLNTALLSARLAEQNRRSAYRPQIPFNAQTIKPQAPYSAPIPLRATIKQNLKSTGRLGKPYVAPAPQRQAYAPQPQTKKQTPQNRQAPNEDMGDSLSYVKMGGGSKIADWQACEKQAGGHYQARSGRYVVKPKFDSCMRAAGYKPEAEAEAELSQKASEKVPTKRRYPAP